MNTPVVCVWVASCVRGLVGQFFSQGTVTGEGYWIEFILTSLSIYGSGREGSYVEMFDTHFLPCFVLYYIVYSQNANTNTNHTVHFYSYVYQVQYK